jgi:hypothetical protein
MKSLTICLFCTSVLALAAAPAGKWTADTPGMSGNLEKTTFDFRVEGDKLSGSVILASGNSYAIEDGSINGDDLSFHITVKMGRDTRLIYTGKLAGEEIKFTREMEGIGHRVEFTARRLP